MGKKPSAVRTCTTLLTILRSYSTFDNSCSGSSGRSDRTIDMVITA